MMPEGIENLNSIKTFFILTLFCLLASKGLEPTKVETYLSYLDLQLARMEFSLKDYIIFFCFILPKSLKFFFF